MNLSTVVKGDHPTDFIHMRQNITMLVRASDTMFCKLQRRRILGETSWALLGQVGSGIVLLIGIRIITELVSPEVYGRVTLMVGIVALGVSIFAYPFVSAGIRLLPEALQRGQRRELGRVLVLLTRRSTAGALVLMAMGGAAYNYLGHGDAGLFVATGLLFLVTVQREFGVHLLIGERRQREATLWQTSDSILRPVLAIGLIYWRGAEAELVLGGYVLASLVVNTIQALVNRGNGHGEYHPKVVGNLKTEVLAYAWPLIPMELLSWFSSLGDRYVIGYLMSATEVGIYAASYTLINEAFHRSAIVLLRIFQPVYFAHFSMNRRARALKVFVLWLGCVVAMGLVGVTALILLQDWVARLLLAPVYHGGAVLMPLIGTGCALQALGTVVAQPLYAMKRTRMLMGVRICGALTALITLPLMVEWQGLMGAALAAPIYFGTEAVLLAMIAKPWSAGIYIGDKR